MEGWFARVINQRTLVPPCLLFLAGFAWAGLGELPHDLSAIYIFSRARGIFLFPPGCARGGNPGECSGHEMEKPFSTIPRLAAKAPLLLLRSVAVFPPLSRSPSQVLKRQTT